VSVAVHFRSTYSSGYRQRQVSETGRGHLRKLDQLLFAFPVAYSVDLARRLTKRYKYAVFRSVLQALLEVSPLSPFGAGAANCDKNET
jgi:hypothetical protein